MLRSLVLFLVLLCGCAGAQRPPADDARIGVEGAAHILAAVDAAAATAAQAEGARPHDPAAFQAKWAAYVTNMLRARASLILAERVVDEWKRAGGSPCPMRAALEGAAGDLGVVQAQLPDLGVDVPAAYADSVAAIARASLVFAPQCTADGGNDAHD
jgi:hypothetical protein